MIKLNIAVGKKRYDTNWKNKQMTWPELLDLLKNTTKTYETVAEYKAMSKDDQGHIKDIGGFVGGHLEGGHRLKGNVKNRSLVTLDVDYAGHNFWEDFTMLNDFAAALYSTHKHTPKSPRLRLIIPLNKPVTPEQYEAIARKIADEIGIDLFDDTTYQPSRLMYWPSTSKDGQYIFKVQKGSILDPQTILDTYEDWSDCSYWPESSRAQKKRKSLKDKQEDPLTKKGAIGAFCRTYTIQETIENFLSDVYEPCDVEDRYTYVNGSTSAGLVVYEDKFAFSNHSTDPAGEQLCNAFDLLRIHKFNHLDEDKPPNTPVTRLPSYKEALKFISEDAHVKKTIVSEGIHLKTDDFAEVDVADYDDGWIEQLEIEKGQVSSSINNLVLILENDPKLKGVYAYNELTRAETAVRTMPWRRVSNELDKVLTDADDANLRHYVECNYKIIGKEKINDAVSVVALKHKYHPVREYLKECQWDGVERVDTLLIDYLGAEDTEYTRAVTRKTLVAAIARVFAPGCKFDYMLTLSGKQGIGKSTLFDRLGGEWFSDSLTSVTGKESYEQLQSVWIMEIGELSALKKSEVEATKLFISKREDRYRRSYGKRVEQFPRQNIFIGTTNEKQFLRDDTGGRRFWVVDLVRQAEQDLFKELDKKTVANIWAEARYYYELGEELKLDPQMEEEAKAIQEEHGEDSPKLGLITAFLETILPKEWAEMDLYQRRDFLHGDSFNKPGEGEVSREKVCAAEIWCEVFEKKLGDLTNYEAKEINKLLDRLPEWERSKTVIKFGKIYGVQRGYRKKKRGKQST